jgi:hypothetical protein
MFPAATVKSFNHPADLCGFGPDRNEMEKSNEGIG